MSEATGIDRVLLPADSWSSIEYDPEKAGLTVVASMEDDDLSYAFDKFVVWRDEATGGLFYANDSGCSCPTPFEDIKRLSDLTRIDPRRLDAFENDARSWADDTYDSKSKVSIDTFQRFMRGVRDAAAESAHP